MKISNILLGLSAIAFLGISCSSSDDPAPTPTPSPTGEIQLVPSTNFIEADGTDAATLTVWLDGADITSQASIYLESAPETPLTSPSFTATQTGDYVLYASKDAKISEKITIRAVAEIPALPADAQPDKYDGFKRRILAIDHTGTGCGFCPFVIGALREIEKSDYADKVVFVAGHSYNSSDPMYTIEAQYLAQAMGVTGYPWVSYDLRKNVKTSNTGSIQGNVTQMKMYIDNELEDAEAVAGLSVATKKVGNEIIVTIGAKVGKDARYKVGAWLLESGIKASQVNNGAPGDYGTHDHALRTGNIKSTNDAMGQYLALSGEFKAGNTLKHVISLPLKDTYVTDNMTVVVVINTPDVEGSAKFYTNNVVSCPVGETVAFEYE